MCLNLPSNDAFEQKQNKTRGNTIIKTSATARQRGKSVDDIRYLCAFFTGNKMQKFSLEFQGKGQDKLRRDLGLGMFDSIW